MFFDNLSIKHYTGPLLEETHYYPFGLTMAGISSKALKPNYVENKKNKFQNQEFNNDLAVDIYEFKYRMDDPQIGRFWQIDPLANKYVYNSTYAFSENKVTGHIELEGLEAVPWQNRNYNCGPCNPYSVGSESSTQVEPKKPNEKKAEEINSQQPNVGMTVTNNQTILKKIIPGVLGPLDVSATAGLTSGQEGKQITKDIAITDGKQDAMTLSIKTPFDLVSLTGSINKEGVISTGVTALGLEAHVGRDGLKPTSKVLTGVSFTDKKGFKIEGNVSWKPSKLAIGLMLAPAAFETRVATTIFKLATRKTLVQ